MDAPDLKARLDVDRKDLLDLSLRNPLINYRPRSRGIEFVGEDPAVLFRLLVQEGRSLTFLPTAAGAEAEEIPREPAAPATDPHDLKLQTPLAAADLQARLLAIHYAARTALEETGINTLFLALGLLQWRDPDDPRPLLAPLVLVPVELQRGSVRERFRLRHDGDELDINLSLAEKLKAAFQLVLPDFAGDEEESEVAAYFDAVETLVGPEGWSVDRRAAILGFFSFGKFLMYRDLDPAAWPADESPEDHPIVRSLLGDGFPASPADPADDAGPAPVAGLATVVDADGTQALALADAAEGRDLVIQGPPGTGKSQTITNLIADAIGRGKTVLFVAEKLAALDVVKRRLDGVGLGEACLELHSHKMGKKAVLDQIRRTLGLRRPPVPIDLDRARLDELGSRLDGYAESLHQPIGTSGVTPYEAIGERLGLLDARGDLPTPELPGIEDWSDSEYQRRLERVERYQDALDRIGGLRDHPFRGCRREDWSPADERRLAERIAVAGHAAATLREASAALAESLRLLAPADRAGCELALRAARRLVDVRPWSAPPIPDWVARRSEIREALAAGRALADLHARLDPVVVPEAWDHAWDDERRVIEKLGRRWWRMLSQDYIRARGRLIDAARSTSPSTQRERLALIDGLAEGRRLRDQLALAGPRMAPILGDRWQGAASDWGALGAWADGMDRLHGEIGDGRLPRGLLEVVADPPPREQVEALARAVAAALRSHREAIARLVEFLRLDEAIRFGDTGGLAELAFREQDDLLRAWAGRLRELPALIGCNALAGGCRAEGLGSLPALADVWPGAPDGLVSAFRLARLEAMLKKTLRERPALGEFDGRAHDRAVAAFRELDRQTLVQTRSRLALAHWNQLPRHEAGGQLGILRRELVKKARHLPVRKLMARAGLAVQAVKPVFMMSPLSVAAYLPPGLRKFDLVIFDEASQVRPVDALGAILRGRQAIVVGDSRQLPPTMFFDRLTAGDEPDDDEPQSDADVESILGLFLAQGAPERMLRWHYRSRHESLIAVSNREFYDGRLVVFPSPDAGRRVSGLIFRHQPATIYDRGRSRTNPGEADTVARAVLAFAREQLAKPAGDRLSLGVATFSSAQMRAILDRVERLRRGDPACEPFFDAGGADPFFVKNLENVQGDERDVIFISVGYGRTAEGTVSMNFGPLNAEGGERRLNVLITRARVRCEVFTNITAADLDPGRTKSRGVQALRSFLAFAQSGRPEGAASDEGPAPSALAAAIAGGLAGAGFGATMGLGAGESRLDLAVTDPGLEGRYALGLVGDGPAYRHAGSSRDRDRLRPGVLEALGWKLQPSWAVDWYRDPEGQRRRLDSAIAESRTALVQPAVPVVPVEPTSEMLGEDGEESALETSPGIRAASPYVLAELSPALAGADLVAMPRDALADEVGGIVRQEGPVHHAEIARRLTDAAGARRIGPRIQEAIDAAIARAIERGEIDRRGDFFAPPGLERPAIRDRGALPAGSRRLDLVADEEIAEAAERVVRDAFAIEAEAIPAAACRLLGFPRMSEEMRGRVAALVDRMVGEGRLTRRSDQLEIGIAEPETSPA